ncbi:MAG: winged helix-turn-helix transcriptional regulator [Afipia sp.]|nr:winged helix-turn-helix transcriptional regulator [Afipia sp.]
MSDILRNGYQMATKRTSARAKARHKPPLQPRRAAVRRFCASTTSIAEATALLRVFSNARRLLILHELMAVNELSVGELVHTVGVPQASLSQHLAKLRAAKLLCARREGKHVYYHIANETAVKRTLQTIDRLLR